MVFDGPERDEAGIATTAAKLKVAHTKLTPLEYLPKSWETMPPGKLLLTVPMQWLAAIPDGGDEAYREFLIRVSDGCKSGDEDWKMLRASLKVSKESAAWVDQHYEDTLVRLLGEAQACALVSLSEEPPCKVLKNNASDVVTNHNRKRKRGSQTIIANVTPLGLARMLSNQWYNDEDMNAYIWRLRAGYPDASLMSSQFYEKLRLGQIDSAQSIVQATCGDYNSTPIHFPLHLPSDHWTQASVTLSDGSGTCTDCYNTAAPLELPNGIKRLIPKMGLGNPSSAIQADHAHMPFQDDNHSCAPLALYSLHRRAGGLALAMKAKKASEVSADLRVIQAAVSAQLISSHVGGKLLSAL